MKLSLQLYTLRNQLDTDFQGTLERVADMGFTRVEPYGFAERAEEFATALRQSGLQAPSGHASLIDGDAPAILDAAAELGMSTVIDPFRRAELWQRPEDIQTAATRLNSITGLAAERGLKIGYHNHNWELETKYDADPSSSAQPTSALEYFASLLDPEVVLEVDVYWALVGGVEPVGLLERLGNRVRLLHLKDGPANGVTKEQLPAGQGLVPITEILAASDADLGVVEFDDYDGDIFEGIARSQAYLTNAGVDAR